MLPQLLAADRETAVDDGVLSESARTHLRDDGRNSCQAARYLLGEAWRAADAAAEHDQLRIDDRDDRGESARHDLGFAGDDFARLLVSSRGGGEDAAGAAQSRTPTVVRP